MRTHLRHKIVKWSLPFLFLLSLCNDVSALSPAEAAEQAKNRTGGTVLQVKSLGDDRYKVKVLLPEGQVRTLSIGHSTEKKSDKNSKKPQ